MGVADSAFGEAGWVGRMPFSCVFQFPLVEGHQLNEAPGYETILGTASQHTVGYKLWNVISFKSLIKLLWLFVH